MFEWEFDTLSNMVQHKLGHKIKGQGCMIFKNSNIFEIQISHISVFQRGWKFSRPGGEEEDYQVHGAPKDFPRETSWSGDSGFMGQWWHEIYQRSRIKNCSWDRWKTFNQLPVPILRNCYPTRKRYVHIWHISKFKTTKWNLLLVTFALTILCWRFHYYNKELK